MTHLTRGALALAVLTLFPIVDATPQDPNWEISLAVTADQMADMYFEQAVALEGDGLWVGAASLYAESAELRTNGDARAYAAYDRAGTLLFRQNEPESARQMFVMAASGALRAGQVHEAAQSFAIAAELSALGGACLGNEEVGRINMELALRLSDSPQLTDEQQVTIRERMDIYKKRVRA